MKLVFIKQSARVLVLAVWLLGAAGCEKPPAARTATDANERKSLPAKPVPVAEANNSGADKDVNPAETPAAGRSDEPADLKVIAYYFHRTMRCPTCLSIEQQAREAVETAYSLKLSGLGDDQGGRNRKGPF